MATHTSFDRRPSRSERKASRRAERHLAHQVLQTAVDFDDLVLPELRFDDPPSNGSRKSPEDRYKFWKHPFWKRRSQFKEAQQELAQEYWLGEWR